MKIAVHLARNRRLLAWCAVSVLLHVLLASLIDRLIAPAALPAPGVPLAVRLAHTAPTTTTPLPASAARPGPDLPPPAMPAAPHAGAALEPPPLSVPAPAPVAAPVATPASSDGTPPAPSDDSPVGARPPIVPQRYRVRPPPSAQLSYAVTRTRPGGTAEPLDAAQLVWQRDEEGNYQVRIDGVLGQIESEGREDDAGIAPLATSERGLNGGSYRTRFDRTAQRIEYLGGSDGLLLGVQDPASLLIQLAGMGLASPAQLGSEIDIAVGSATGVEMVRFEFVGRETLATAAGELATVRLAQQSAAGKRRIELWLAPQQHWLPVQIRITEPDGTSANQVVTAIETGGAPER